MARIKPQALLLQSKKKKGPTRISAVTVILCGLIIVLTVFFLYSTYRNYSLRSKIHHNEDESYSSNYEVDSKKPNLPGYAILNTSKGSIMVELFKDGSFEVVDKFVKLGNKGRFKGMRFRHVIKHYMIQAGDADNHGAAGDWKGKNYGQLNTSLKHEAFMLGTSKAKNNEKGFELFITTAPIPDLTEKVIVFGRVIKGEDVVQEIEEVDTDEYYQPKSHIVITDVTLQWEL